MGARVDRGADLGEMLLHSGSIAPRHDQASALAFLRADCAEDIGGLRALVVGRRGARAARSPAAGDLVLLTDPGLILPPEFYLDAGRKPVSDLCERGGEVFLKAASEASFWA